MVDKERMTGIIILYNKVLKMNTVFSFFTWYKADCCDIICKLYSA